jgi:16S rRNA (cytosine1402-N4)-methyltransferase
MSIEETGFHEPVMGPEVVSFLNVVSDGWLIDATVGGGGHSELLLTALPQAKVLGLDRDPAAIEASKRRLLKFGERVQIITTSFSRMCDAIAESGADRIRGVLFDLGVSSRQIDDPDRGFSYRQDGPLDMRMGPDAVASAEEVVNTFSEADLSRIFRQYGEERRAKQIARAVCVTRVDEPIRSTRTLADIVAQVVRQPHTTKSQARVFQAIRIEVNGELDQLGSSLESAIGALSPGGRLAVLTYHSLEDRIVKQVVRGTMRDRPPSDFPVDVDPGVRLREVNARGTTPSVLETERNPRARSARLRVGERLGEDLPLST